MLCNSLFDNAEFEERKVVVEEINRAKDHAAAFTNEEIFKLIFKGASLSLPVGALPKEILAYDREKTLEFLEISTNHQIRFFLYVLMKKLVM